MTLCGREYLLIHLLLNNWLTLSDDLSMYSSLRYLIEVKHHNFCDLKPTRSRVDHHCAGDTNIIPNTSATRIILSYILTMHNCQVHMHHTPRF